ncbi:hypothetical protein TrispH2_002318 [Trichoplax sp. H2]|nr:hypothetical protein TrispH2_002318 [Trichoplax sp. H2]|eukprot:RDD45291.1 hypothetical protein TrispH2_002318 [Trichoplax sp. H2]
MTQDGLMQVIHDDTAWFKVDFYLLRRISNPLKKNVEIRYRYFQLYDDTEWPTDVIFSASNF